MGGGTGASVVTCLGGDVQGAKDPPADLVLDDAQIGQVSAARWNDMSPPRVDREQRRPPAGRRRSFEASIREENHGRARSGDDPEVSEIEAARREKVVLRKLLVRAVLSDDRRTDRGSVLEVEDDEPPRRFTVASMGARQLAEARAVNRLTRNTPLRRRDAEAGFEFPRMSAARVVTSLRVDLGTATTAQYSRIAALDHDLHPMDGALSEPAVIPRGGGGAGGYPARGRRARARWSGVCRGTCRSSCRRTRSRA